MKHSFITSLVAVCLLLIAPLVPISALETSDIDDPKVIEAFVDGLVLPLMKNNNSPSGVVSIVKNGKLAFEKGYGYQSLEKDILVDPKNTVFRVASISKLFVWVSVMQMVEQGKLDLDADVNTYLKTFQIRDTFPGQPVTMRHIMTHSAGFEDGGAGYFFTKEGAEIKPLAEALGLYQPARINPPGAQTAYSNYATSVAGLIVANLSGIEFNTYVEQNIFEPLGMIRSSFVDPLTGPLGDDLAAYYAYEGGRYVLKPAPILTNMGPAGGLGATSTDIMLFARAIMNGGANDHGRILKEETVEQMLTRNFSHDDRMMGMALGFYETEQNGFRIVGHGGDLLYIHSDVGIDLQNDMAVFISFTGVGGRQVRNALMPALYDSFLPSPKSKLVPLADFAERAEKYVGTYHFWRSSFSTFEKAQSLMGGLSVASSGDNTLVLPIIGEVVEIEKNLFQQIRGEKKVAFQENGVGEITGFVVDGLPFMSTFKSPFYYTKGFNFPLLALSFLVFVGIIVRRFYQRAAFKAFNPAEKKALSASLWVAIANLLVLILGFIVLTTVGEALYVEIPVLFKLWLVVPIIATALGFYHVYSTVVVWREDLLANVWARVRYSVVAVCALFICWFYYFWNILGFNYLG